MNYILTKMSSPGFELKSEHLKIHENILQGEICSDCKSGLNPHEDMRLYIELMKNKEKLKQSSKNKEKLEVINLLIITELLGTSCGAEYWFEQENEQDSSEYIELLNENMIKYNIFKGDL